MGARWRTVAVFGQIGNMYIKYPVFAWRTLIDTTPVTTLLLFAAPGCCLADFSARGILLRVSRVSAGLLRTGVYRVHTVLGLPRR